MKRKILALSLVLSLVIGLSACNLDSGNEPVQTATGILPIKEVTSQTEEILTESETDNFETSLDREDYITICNRQYNINSEKVEVYLKSKTDISNLKYMKNLKELTLRALAVSDTYEYAEGITGLEELKETLENIRTLKIYSVDFENTSYLKNALNLETLILYHSNISDFSFISDLKNIKVIFSDATFGTNIDFLKNLQSLQELYIENGFVEDIGILKDLDNLNTLYYSEARNLKHVMNLQDLKNIQHIMIWTDSCQNEVDELFKIIKNKNPNCEFGINISKFY